MKIQSLAGDWNFRQAGSTEWLPATVPGGVHTDLLALGRIPDPFYGDNEKQLQWVAEADWEYQHQFIAGSDLLSQPQVWLVCAGLDTLATIRMNGQVVGRAENMFRQYRWDVKALLKPGHNDLNIFFDSPVRFAAAQQAVRPLPGVSQAIPGGPYLRKAPCQFGWDWGPQLPPIGIWKDIRLEGYENARIAQVRFSQQHSSDQVTVGANIFLETWKADSRALILRLIAPDGRVFESRAPVLSDPSTSVSVRVTDPQLWWPNGHGDQNLYTAVVELHQAGTLVDEQVYMLGLRTLELKQDADEWGRSFTFIVNGQPIFVKGSNWIPTDSFPTRITRDSLESLIRSAAETHQNMLRVWGGGFYEDEIFYDLCDRYGILVWQEFIFSCSVYPLYDDRFLENVQAEVVDNIRRLRHRASLAIWCGNNEMEWGWVEWGWKAPEYQDLKSIYDEFFHRTLPSWCAREDPDRPYWPSSPSSGIPFEDPNGQKQGDAHYWDVWHGRKPFTAYRNQYPRFMSEFGFQALPPLATIRTYAAEDDWNMTSYVMEQHQKNDSGNALMVAQMLDTFQLPKDFDSLVYLRLLLQAEGIRYGVEHWRRNPRRVSGTLYWQLNDCWPVASWSSLDYYGRWKALHYAARRFYAPLLLSIVDSRERQEVVLTNEFRTAWEGSLIWSLERLDGQVIRSGETQVKAPPSDAVSICQLDFSNDLAGDLPRKVVFIAELLQKGQLVARQTAFFVPTKHLALTDPTISTRVSIQDGQLYIEMIAISLARLVECTLEGKDVVFSDNYFDLPAGRPVVISAPLPSGWNLSKAQSGLKVRSIYDSYAHGRE